MAEAPRRFEAWVESVPKKVIEGSRGLKGVTEGDGRDFKAWSMSYFKDCYCSS